MSLQSSGRESATPGSAILLVIAAGLAFSCLDTSAKYLVVGGMSAVFVSWARFVGHVVSGARFFRPWRNPRMMRAKSLPPQVLRGAFLFGSTMFNVMALETLQLAETTSIYFFGADGDHRACRPAARRMGRLAALAGDPVGLCRRARSSPGRASACSASAISSRSARCCRTASTSS